MTVIHLSARHLLAPAAREDSRWEDYAACARVDPDLFHPTGRDSVMLAAAKLVCSDCPVTRECLQDALDSGEDQGVRGGLSEQERRAIHKRADPRPHQFGMPGKAEMIAGEPGEYLRLLAEGLSAYEIARVLKTNVQTVNNVARLLAEADETPAGGEATAEREPREQEDVAC